MKYFRTFVIISIFVFGVIFLTKSVFAQTPEDEAKKLGITFPISELGNCANVASCMSYCQEPANQEDCTAFAKKHGFYQVYEDVKTDILRNAAQELGCESEATCRSYCEQPASQQKCIDFAKKHGMAHQTADPPADVIAAAKRELGCASAESCMKYCEDVANRSKCYDFASKQGFGGVPPAGGDYEKFCGENPNKCKAGRLSGPGGCDSAESCMKYCQEHPAECGVVQPPPTGGQTPQAGGDYEKFCAENPDKCKLGGYPAPTGVNYTPNPYYTPMPNYTMPPNYTPPPEGSYTPPPDYTPNPYYSPSPEVQGAKTKSLWQKIFDFFAGIF